MKKQHKDINRKQQQPLVSLSLIVTGNLNSSSWQALSESIQKLKPEYTDIFEIITEKPDSAQAAAWENESTRQLSGKDNLTYIDAASSSLEYIQTATREAKSEYVAYLDASLMERSFNINDLLALCQKEFIPDTLLDLHFQNEELLRKKEIPMRSIFALSSAAAKYMAEAIPDNAQDFRYSLNFLFNRLDIPSKSLVIHQNSPFDESKVYTVFGKPGYFASRRLKMKNSLNWFFTVPVRELKNKPEWRYLAAYGNSINRLIFVSLAIALFIAMPLLSLNTSISGDEDKHVFQAKSVYNYFATGGKDKSYMKDIWGPFYAYPISFDVAMHILTQVFKIDHIYEFRHVFNSWMGWLAILFAGLLAMRIASWRAGIVAMLFLFLTPSFLGHSYNNPKDIPFAFGYIFSLYYIFQMVKEFPRFRNRTIILMALSIGIALNVRSGGLLLIAYLGFFVGLAYLFSMKIKQMFSAEGIRLAKKTLLILLGIIVSGYILGIMFWPYALEHPIRGPLDALSIMTNFTVSLRQIFEGKFIWSDHVPWYYSLKYILITVPLVVFLGLFFFFMLLPRLASKGNRLWMFMIFFTFAFPVFWVIYQKSNVYGGWRHLLFAYTMLVVASAVGTEAFLRLFSKKSLRLVAAVPFVALSVSPALHIIRNHPDEYIYYNELIGGVDKAYGNYETDYYYHSVRQACLWLKDKINSDPQLKNRKIIIASNFTPAVSYYFRDMKDSVKIIYVRYYDRGEYDWDFAILANSYVNPYQLRKNLWPPKNTIHEVKVDDVPICAVVERKNKEDFYGYQELDKKQYPLAIPTLQQAVQFDPRNEAALLDLAKAYMDVGQSDTALMYIDQCLKVYPDYDKALNLMGIAYMSKNDLNTAISVFMRITKVNPKYVSAYYNLGYVYKLMNNPTLAIDYLKQAIYVNKNYTPTYYLLADILRQMGRTDEANQILQMVKQ